MYSMAAIFEEWRVADGEKDREEAESSGWTSGRMGLFVYFCREDPAMDVVRNPKTLCRQ